MPDEIQVLPRKNGRWTIVVDGSENREGFDTRREAIDAARREGGAEEVRIVREDGSEETVTSTPNCRVVLMRPDGSEYGELNPAPSSSGPAQTITLNPASERTEAAELEQQEDDDG